VATTAVFLAFIKELSAKDIELQKQKHKTAMISGLRIKYLLGY
jgi:hypothetical protein